MNPLLSRTAAQLDAYLANGDHIREYLSAPRRAPTLAAIRAAVNRHAPDLADRVPDLGDDPADFEDAARVLLALLFDRVDRDDTPSPTHQDVPPGLTVSDIAARYRVGEDKVRGWIKRGELPALNTAAASCGRPRYVVTADALAAFQQGRAASVPPMPKRRPRTVAVDYYA